MTSVNEIKTLALKELGRTDIPDFFDGTESDVLNLNLNYPLVYQDCLGKHKWNFAKEVVALSNPDVVVGRYKYRFLLPKDLIVIRAVFSDENYLLRLKKIYAKK